MMRQPSRVYGKSGLFDAHVLRPSRQHEALLAGAPIMTASCAGVIGADGRRAGGAAVDGPVCWRIAVPTAPAWAQAWLQGAGLGADAMGTGATQRGKDGGGR